MWSKILSTLVTSILGSVLSWWNARKDKKERIETIKNEARLEVENASLRAGYEAQSREDAAPVHDLPDTIKRMRDGTF